MKRIAGCAARQVWQVFRRRAGKLSGSPITHHPPSRPTPFPQAGAQQYCIRVYDLRLTKRGLRLGWDMDAIIFDAQVQAVKTLVDGGLRVTLDLPETAIDEAAQLMRLKRDGAALRVACAVVEQQGMPEA